MLLILPEKKLFLPYNLSHPAQINIYRHSKPELKARKALNVKTKIRLNLKSNIAMKNNQIFTSILLLAFTSFISNQLCAQSASPWSQNSTSIWNTNLNTNVGIGTSTPTHARLQFGNQLGNLVTFYANAEGKAYGFGLYDHNLVAYIPPTAADRFSIRANGYNGDEKFVVTGEGNVGLGGINPTQARLQFDNAMGNKVCLFSDNTSNGYGFGLNNRNLVAYIPDIAGGTRFSIRTNNSTGVEKFQVYSDGTVSTGNRILVGLIGTAGYSLLHFKNGTITTGAVIRSSLGDSDLSNAPLILHSSTLSYINEGGPRMFITTTGNVGIGTTNPTHTLSVNGTIQAKEIRVETGWADYVFASDFTLRPLTEVETYISQHKHLPDVTSAADIQQNGLQVGKQMTEMMQKVEELTLYLIDLKKENDVLKTRVVNLEQSLK
jgi:hypothetical protein